MKIVKMVKFDGDDKQMLDRIVGLCNMAASFFMTDSEDLTCDGLKAITRLRAGCALEFRHIEEAYKEVNKALARVRGTPTHSCFPAELNKRYCYNLVAVLNVLKEWKELADEVEVKVDCGQVP